MNIVRKTKPLLIPPKLVEKAADFVGAVGDDIGDDVVWAVDGVEDATVRPSAEERTLSAINEAETPEVL
jgi:hypothetical protein